MALPTHCACWMLILLGVGSSSAAAGVVRGTIHIVAPRMKPAGEGSSVSGAVRPSRDPVQDAVVYLERIPPKLEKKLARDAEAASVGQGRGRFVPSPLAIAAGTTVTFENRDSVYHSVFSVSSAKRFDLGKYAPRASRTVRFDQPGIVQLFCDIDPGETGYICVTPNHAYTQPDSSGAFVLPSLPRGSYRLTVWHPDFTRVTRDIEMPSRADVSIELRH